MSRLGTYGQWGNQVFQYAFIRAYARRYGADYGVPPWAGQYLFGHRDPPVGATLPMLVERLQPAEPEPLLGVPIPPAGSEYLGRDFRGWGQYHTSWYAPDKDFIQSLFCVVEPERNRVQSALAKLRQRGETLISLHFRRGDSGRMIFFFTPMVWCLKWLRENWRRFPKPVLFIATEDPSLAKHFHAYSPILIEDVGVNVAAAAPQHYQYPYGRRFSEPRQLDFFPDWYVLQNSDVILASDSTFSVSAGWTSETVGEFWRPRLSLGGFERLDPWNMSVSPREHLDHFPGIPGTQLPENPRFWGRWRPQHPSVAEDPAEIAKWEAIER